MTRRITIADDPFPRPGKVRIQPQLGPLSWARGRMVHPKGFIEADVAMHHGLLTGTITLPPGISGELVLPDKTQPLTPGRQDVSM